MDTPAAASISELLPHETSAIDSRILQLYGDSCELERYPALTLSILEDLTASDFAVFGEVDHETWQNRGFTSDTSPEVLEALKRYDETPREHPFFEALPSYYRGRILTIDDCLSPAEKETSLIMQRVYLPIGVRHILAFNFEAGGKVLAFGALRRSSIPYSARDRGVAQLLRRHFELAYHQFTRRALRVMDARQRIHLSFPQFTERQLDVAAWLASGKSNAVISKLLGITEAGVKYHLRAIFDQIGTEDRTATALALVQTEPGFISCHPPYPLA